MSEIQIQRGWSDARATLGYLTIHGLTHNPIFTLENPERAVRKDTRIPAGRYRYTKFMSPKFKYEVLLLHDVPGFTMVEGHIGNYEHDTDACILWGFSSMMSPKFGPMVGGSENAHKFIMTNVDREGFITVLDEPRASQIGA